MVRMICCIVSLAVALCACTACPGAAVRATQVIVDCTKENQADIERLVLEFRPLLQLESPDWSAVIAAAVASGRNIGGCALAKLVDQYLGGLWAVNVAPSAPASVSKAVESGTRTARDELARAQFERYRQEFAGGAIFRTEAGDR